jgi:hypothetical protein
MLIQGSKDVCVRIVTERRRHEQEKAVAARTGKLGSFLHGAAAAAYFADLERIWIVIGRSVDRATRLSSPRAAFFPAAKLCSVHISIIAVHNPVTTMHVL